MPTSKWTLLLSCTLVATAAMQSGGKQFVRPAPGQTPPYNLAVKAGGIIYVSGTLPTDLKADIKGQTNQVFADIKSVLQQAGSSLDNVVWANVMLQNAADFPAVDQIYREQFKGEPPARTTIFGEMVRPGALLEIQVTAVPNGAPRKVILPAGWMKPTSPYNYAIQAGDTLFLSGLVSRNAKDNSMVAGDVGAQTKVAMDNAGEILKAAGMSYGDLVDTRIGIRDITKFEDMNKVYRAYWEKDRPVRATVQAGLPGTFDVEITMVAIKGAAPREVIIPPAADGTAGQSGPNFSPAIKVGNRLFVSGGTGNTDTNLGDMKAQAAETLARLGRSLRAAGFDFKDVVSSEVWVTDVAKFNDMNEGYRPVFPTDAPVRATIGISGLAGKDAIVEMAVTAVK